MLTALLLRTIRLILPERLFWILLTARCATTSPLGVRDVLLPGGRVDPASWFRRIRETAFANRFFATVWFGRSQIPSFSNSPWSAARTNRRHAAHRGRVTTLAAVARSYCALSLLMLSFAAAVAMSIAANNSCAWALSFSAFGFNAATALALRSWPRNVTWSCKDFMNVA